MKTRFILHGGFDKELGKQTNDAFFSEILSTAPKVAMVLLVYFAKEADRIENNRQEDIGQFNKNKGDRELVFTIADQASFLEQVKNSDVVYLHGGHTGMILDVIKKYPDLKELFAGKIIAGDSAGANVLAAAFYSLKIGVGEGLGIVLIKLLCHYKEENKYALDAINPELETVYLPEYQYKVFEIEL